MIICQLEAAQWSLPFSDAVVGSKAVFQIRLWSDIAAKGVGETTVS